MKTKIPHLVERIQVAFKGVQLENGISWREANVLDNYGTEEERRNAKALDEKNDWTKVPDSLIGDIKYQSGLNFLDTPGLRFYLPACMIYTLTHYTSSQSLLIHSIIYTLNHKKTALDLQAIINADQKACIVDFLATCLSIGDDYFDITKLEEKMEKYWINNP